MRELSLSCVCALALVFAGCGDSGGAGGSGGSGGSGGAGGIQGGIEDICTAYCEAGCLLPEEDLPACEQSCLDLVGDCEEEFRALAECAIANECNAFFCGPENNALVACVNPA